MDSTMDKHINCLKLHDEICVLVNRYNHEFGLDYWQMVGVLQTVTNRLSDEIKPQPNNNRS